MKNLLSFLTRRQTPPVISPVSGQAIRNYLSETYRRDPDRLRDEVENRGLSFGQIRATDGSGFSNKFSFSFPEERPDVNRESFKATLQTVLESNGLGGQIILRDGWTDDEIECVYTEDAAEAGEGGWIGCFRGGQSFSEKRLMSIRVGKYGLSFEAYGVKAIEVMLAIAKQFNIAAEPVNYAFESDVPLDHIVGTAVVYHDPVSDKYYSEITYDRYHEKHLVFVGITYSQAYGPDDKLEGFWPSPGTKEGCTLVFAGSRDAHIKLNNQRVVTCFISQPTYKMAALRGHILDELDKRYRCRVDNCGRRAVKQVHSVRFEMGSPGGMSSMGGITYVCDNPDHESKAKGTSAIRHEVYNISPTELAQAW